MYNTLVRPILEYASQVLTYKNHHFNKTLEPKPNESACDLLTKLDKFQNRVLKSLINCPKSTPPALLRILTGTVPIRGRIDILKMRYFWRSIKQDKTHLSRLICERNRHSKLGFANEVFKICSKYNHLNVWVGICKPKVNPLREIRQVVEKYCFTKDLQKVLQTKCLYTTLFIKKRVYKDKKYKLEQFLAHMGQFPDAEGRKFFLYALLDTCQYERRCPRCNCLEKDIISHILSSCEKSQQLRLNTRLKFIFYGVPTTFNFNDKAIFSLVIDAKLIFLRVLCTFLTVIGYY